MKHKTKRRARLMLAVIFLGLLPCAAESEEAPSTPMDRVRMNAKKSKLNPDLSGRWNPKERTPAANANLPDNLALRIISDLGRDPDLVDAPLTLKAYSKNGSVRLEGVVNTEAEKNLIAEKVKRMRDVKSVENALRVKTSESDFLK